MISIITLIVPVLIHKLITLSARCFWTWLRHRSWSISHHLIILILRVVELLKVSFLPNILIKILLRFHLLKLLFLSLVHYWHFILLLVLIFFIFLFVYWKRLNAVSTSNIFRRFRSLNSFISWRLIISMVSFLRRPNFISILFDLGAKTWNMIFFFFLFNQNRFLIDFLDR